MRTADYLSGRAAWLASLGLLCGLLAVPAWAQTAVSVTAASSTFQGWMLSGGTLMADPQADQQTGLYSADFFGAAAGTAGLSPTPTVAVPSAMVTAGTIGGAGNDYIVFRFRMTDINGNKDYLGSALSVGIGFSELSGPGKVTIYATVDSANSGPKFYFQGGGTGLNESPSTTTLDDGGFANNPYSKAAPLLLTAGTNWSYAGVTSKGEQSYDRTAVTKTDENLLVTFAVKFTDLQAATRALTGNTTFTLNYNTEMAFVAWTASQGNAINQDINGTAVQASSKLTTTWSSMGAFTDYVTAEGYKRPVPEATTVVQVGVLLAVGAAGTLWRRRRAAGCAPAEAARTA